MQATPVYISLARGLAQSTDPDMVAVNQGTLKLENSLISKKEGIVKRPGTVALSNLDTNGAAIPAFWRLADRGESMVGVAPYGSVASLYSYSDIAQRWAPIPSTIRGPTSYSLTSVAGGQINTHSSAYLGGYVCVAFINATGEAEAHILDAATGATLWSRAFSASGGETVRTKVLACNNLFVVLADDINNQQIDALVVDPANPVGVVIVPPSGNTHPFQTCLDAIVVGNTVHAAYIMNSGLVQGFTLTPALPSGGSWTTYSMTDAGVIALAPTECMSFVRDLGSSGKIGLVTVDLTNGARLHWNFAVAGGNAAPATSTFVETTQTKAHHTLNVAAHTTTNAAAGDVQVILEIHPSDLFTATCAGVPNGTAWAAAGAGVGKTISNSTGSFAVDGHTLALNDVVLVTAPPAGLSAKDLGLYKVTATAPIQLTRATNFDTAAKMTRDALVRVTAGNSINNQYHVRKTLDIESVASPAAPGIFTIDVSALVIDSFVPFGNIFTQLITQYRRYDRFLYVAFKNAAGGVSSSIWTRGLGLTSQPYLHNGHRFVWANYDNGTEASHQGSYFLLECPATTATTTATPQAAFAVDFEAGQQYNSHLQDIAINSDGNALGAILVRTAAVAIDDGQRTIQLAEIELNPASLGHQVEIGSSLFVPGGILGQYDGRNYFPALFPFAPDGISATPASNPGGLGNIVDAGKITKTGTTPPDITITGTPTTPAVIWIQVTTGGAFTGVINVCVFKWSSNRGGTYTTSVPMDASVPLGTTGLTVHFASGTYATDNIYKTSSESIYRIAVVAKSTDANGRVMRGEPDYCDVTLYAGQSQISLDVLPYYRLADKPNLQMEVYRSQVNVPEVLNLFSAIPATTGADFLNIIMSDSDAAIASNALLYTSGDPPVLSFTPVGGVSDLCVQGQRIFAIEMDDPTIVLTSTPLVRGWVPGFTDTGYLQSKSAVAALASFAENLIVFASSVYGMPDSAGPSAQGQGSWPELQILDPAVTTTNPLSVAVTPDGVVFLSQNPADGYQILNRSLLVEPFGIDVRDYFPDNVVSTALYVPKQSQLRIYTTKFGQGATLIYDATHNQWSTFTGQDALSATLMGGTPVYCAFGSGAVRLEAVGNYLEATTFGQPGVAYDQDILSPNIQIYIGKAGAAANVGGFLRLRDLVGRGRSTGFLLATLSIDIYRDFSATPAISLQTTHPNDGAWKFRGGFKCSAFQVRMRISQALGQPPTIMGFTAGICAKQGVRRVSGRNAPSV